MKKAIVVIAPSGFQDYEYAGTVEELKKAKIAVEVASTKKGKCTGAFGTIIEAKSIDELNVDEFDAIAFIGGPGTPLVRADGNFVALAKKFFDDGKVVGAICWAPTILGKAGVLEGKNATIWLGNDREYGKTTDAVIADFGAKFVNRPVVADGKVVTANGPPAAHDFGKKLTELLK